MIIPGTVKKTDRNQVRNIKKRYRNISKKNNAVVSRGLKEPNSNE